MDRHSPSIVSAVRPRQPGLLLLAGAVVLAVALGVGVARGLAVPAVVLSVAGALLLLGRIRLASILGAAFLLAAIPAVEMPRVRPDDLILAGEVMAFGIVFLGAQPRLNVSALWWALAFVILYWLAAEQSIAAGGAALSPRFGFAAASTQILLIAAGTCRDSNDEEVTVFSRIVCLIGILLALWSIGEFVLNRGLAYPFLGGVRRAVGPFGNPNYFGALLAQLAVLAFALLLVQRRRHRSIALAAAATGVCTIGVLATVSRGAILALAAGLLVAATYRLGRRRRVAAWILVGIVAAAMAPVVVRKVESERISVTPATPLLAQQQLAESLRARYLAFRVAVELAASHPLTGIGLERFPAAAQRDPKLGIYMDTHDEPIRVAAEAGLPAALALAAVLWITLHAVRRRSEDVRLLVLPVAVVYLCVSLFLNSLEFVALSYPCAILLFLGSGRARDEDRSTSVLRSASEVPGPNPTLPVPVA